MAKPFRDRFEPAWWIMATLAIAISGYALAFFFVDGTGAASLKMKFAELSFAAWSHIIGGGLALLLGAFQMNQKLRKKALVWHKLLGKVYLICVLFSGLGGLVLAWFAEGGALAKTGFGVLGAGWLYTGAMAYIRIRKGNIASHRRWMIRNYALTFAAVTLRIYLPVSLVAGASFSVAYSIIAWMCWLPNLFLAEWMFIYRPARRSVRRALDDARV